MGMPDPAILEDLLQREVDGNLRDGERRQLDLHLRSSAALRREQEQLQRVVALVEKGRIPVKEGFQQRVMEALPPASWEARSARAWRLPAAILVALGALGTVLAKTAQPAAGSIAGALSAAFELMITAALTGFGLLGTSWKGLQIAFRSIGAGSPWAMTGLVVLVLGLNVLLFVSLRPRPRLAPAAKEGDSGTRGS